MWCYVRYNRPWKSTHLPPPPTTTTPSHSRSQDRNGTMVLSVSASASLLATILLLAAPQNKSHAAFLLRNHHHQASCGSSSSAPNTHNHRLQNVYDDWRADAVVDTMHLCSENVEICLEEFIQSDYGSQMFGYERTEDET